MRIKTTGTLDDELCVELKKLADNDHISFTEMLNRTLRAGLHWSGEHEIDDESADEPMTRDR